jgi:hypothetical protein
MEDGDTTEQITRELRRQRMVEGVGVWEKDTRVEGVSPSRKNITNAKPRGLLHIYTV